MMDVLKITRFYKWKEKEELKINSVTDFIKVERKHDIKLTPAEEFALYVLRLHYNGYSASQGAYGDIMEVTSNRFSAYVNKLQEKGFIRIHKKIGRSKWYEMLKDPKNDWNKIPKSFVKDNFIEWEDRLFIIKLFNLVLKDVNEIHYEDKEIARLMGISPPTFRQYRDALELCGIIEKLPKTRTNPNGGYRIDIDALFGLDDSDINDRPVYSVSAERKHAILVKKSYG